MKAVAQTTITDEVRLTGIGVHSGKPASLVLRPAAANTGIVFRKTGQDTGFEAELRASHANVVATSLSTVLGEAGTGQIATVEHLLAAVNGLGIDNIEIEIDGDEVPIMDGSAEAFVDAIEQVGVISQAARRRYIKVLKPVRVEAGGAVAELRPHDGRQIEVEIDFDSEVIGRQAYVYDLDNGDFREELARARTFGFMRDVERLWAGGFALGASFDNTVVLGDGEVMNPEGLRYSDEFARHKALDAVGDLMLAGAPILGAYRSVRGGHRLNCAMVAALMADRDAWTWAESPARRETAGADVGAMMPAAAYGPDVS